MAAAAVVAAAVVAAAAAGTDRRRAAWPDTLPTMERLALVLLLCLPGCADRERSAFSSVPDRDDDDVGDDDDATAPGDDDDVGDDDDATDPDPCGAYTVSPEAPPVIDHGGSVGTLSYLFPAGCGTFGAMQELFGGWVDGAGNGLDVSATLADTPFGTLEDLVGRALPVDQVTPFVAELDLGTTRFLAPEDLGGVYLSTLVDGERWQACFYGHGGTWIEEDGDASVSVPDPLQFVCVQ